jgi:hypothetical protein
MSGQSMQESLVPSARRRKLSAGDWAKVVLYTLIGITFASMIAEKIDQPPSLKKAFRIWINIFGLICEVLLVWMTIFPIKPKSGSGK